MHNEKTSLEMVKNQAVAQRRSVVKMFLKISQNSQKYSCDGVSFLMKLQTGRLQLY